MDIKEFLEQTLRNWNSIGHPALLERFISRNGRQFELGPPPNELGTPKECFHNATSHVFYVNSNSVYVEGYVWRKGFPLLIHHAWASVDEKAIELTLQNPEDCQYFGVEFDIDLLFDKTFENGYYGLLDGPSGIDIKLMLELDPGMIEFIPENLRKYYE